MTENSSIAYIRRRRDVDILAFLNARADHKNVLLVEGARQVGKTRLVEHALIGIAARKTQMNLERDRRVRSLIDECEEFREFEDLLQDQFGFDGASHQVLFIDEAQESANLGRYVRFMKEEWPHATVILSGSSLRRLFRSGVRYPVGRVQRMTLGPFSFSEFLEARGKSHLAPAVLSGHPPISAGRHEHLLGLLDEFLSVGGLPAVVCNDMANETPHDALARILADYDEDFRRILGEDAAHLAKACLRSVANHLGNVSKNTSVVPAASGSQSNRIGEVFDRLEAWHMLIRSEQLSASPEKSHNFLPKRYVFDTGIARHLREAAVPAIRVIGTMDAESRKPLGGVIENQTAIELSRHFERIQGWKRSPSGGEVDFVVKKDGTTFPIECKASLNIGKRHLRGISEYLRRYDMSLGFTLSLAPYQVFRLDNGRNIVNLPFYSVESLPHHFSNSHYGLSCMQRTARPPSLPLKTDGFQRWEGPRPRGPRPT